MKAEVLSVGTELLLGQILNENARYLSRRLAALGFDVYFQTTVGDNADRIKDALRLSLQRADLVIVTGGLGPTEDDLTRETVAEEMGCSLEENPEALAWIESFFKRRARPVPEASRRQALVPKGARVLQNPRGTAPGLVIPDGKKRVVLLPGPPREMVPIWEEGVEPLLLECFRPQAVIRSRLLKVYGLGEPDVEERVRSLTHSKNPTVAPYTSGIEVHLRITAKAATPGEAEGLLIPYEHQIEASLGPNIFGVDDEEIEEAIARDLKASGRTLAVAESLTGGLVTSRVVNVPGASSFFLGGITAYTIHAKETLLGVPRDIIGRYGTVSWQCAMAMASGVRKALGSDIGVGVTGIAGPKTQEASPIGTVYVAVDDGLRALVRRARFLGKRNEVRFLAAQETLGSVWWVLSRTPAKENPVGVWKHGCNGGKRGIEHD